jgi:hypothetical protein
MSRPSSAAEALPPASAAALRKLAADLALARRRRKQSLKAWAQRLNVSVPTLMRMEKGDPSVGMGVYATALWMINRHEAMGALADPKEDMGALELDIRKASGRHARRAGEADA